MKKLVLIVFLAVVASRVLSDRDDAHGRHAHRPAHGTWLAARDQPSTAWGADDDAATRPDQPRAVYTPQAPEGSAEIRTIPWRRVGAGPDAPNAPPAPRGPRAKRRPGSAAQPAEPTPKVAPSWFPKSEADEERLARPDAAGVRVLLGHLSISEERAKLDLRKSLKAEVADWLAADVPMSWSPPPKLVDRMVLGTYVQTATWTFGPRQPEATPDAAAAGDVTIPELDRPQTLYRAGQKLDFSEARRAELVESYRGDVASARMRRLASIVGVVLVVLALVSFYVRADEATKGYYTNRLRVLASAGLGVAGAIAYRYWA